MLDRVAQFLRVQQFAVFLVLVVAAAGLVVVAAGGTFGGTGARVFW
jgi:hypothetical protein